MRMTCAFPNIPSRSPSPPRGEGRGEGDAPRAFPRILAARPPHPNPLPAFGGPMVRLPRQRKRSLCESGGEREPLAGRRGP
ncbi:Phosphate regulon sensor protein PhoR (SphS) (EC 2.7.13.3) [Azospirillum melinis]